MNITDDEIKVLLTGINNGHRSKSELVQYCKDHNFTIDNYTDKVYHLSKSDLILIETPLSGGSYDLIDWQSAYLTGKGEAWLTSHSEEYISEKDEDDRWKKRERHLKEKTYQLQRKHVIAVVISISLTFIISVISLVFSILNLFKK